jgi:hypothetical protein
MDTQVDSPFSLGQNSDCRTEPSHDTVPLSHVLSASPFSTHGNKSSAISNGVVTRGATFRLKLQEGYFPGNLRCPK